MATQLENRQAGTNGTASRVDQFVGRQLKKTTQQVRVSDIVTGLIALVSYVVAFFLVAAIIDAWVWPYTPIVRLMLLALFLIGLGAIAWSFIVPFFLKRINPQYAAKMIEEAKPEFKNSILNYLNLKGQKKGTHKAILNEVSRRAATDLSTISPDAAVDKSNLIKVGFVLVALVAIAIAYFIFSPINPWPTVKRILSPGSKIAKPAAVLILQVNPKDTSVFFGERVDVSAKVMGKNESENVRLIYSSKDEQIVDAELEMKKAESGNVYSAILSTGPAGIQKSLEYRIEAGDGVSETYSVTVRPNPTISIERIRISPPKYTQLPERIVEGKGEIQAVEGSKVEITAKANLPIEFAYIVPMVERNRSSGEAEFREMRTIQMKVDQASAVGRIVAALNSNRDRGQFTHYKINFRSRDQHRNERPNIYPIRVIADLDPEIQIVEPAQQEVTIPVNQALPIHVWAADLDYEITSVDLQIDHNGQKIFEGNLFERDKPQSPGERVVCRTQITPADLGLSPGDKAILFATAADNRISTSSELLDPNVTRSENYTLIVTDAIKEQSQDSDRQPQREQDSSEKLQRNDQDEENSDQSENGEDTQSENEKDQNSQNSDEPTNSDEPETSPPDSQSEQSDTQDETSQDGSPQSDQNDQPDQQSGNQSGSNQNGDQSDSSTADQTEQDGSEGSQADSQEGDNGSDQSQSSSPESGNEDPQSGTGQNQNSGDADQQDAGMQQKNGNEGGLQEGSDQDSSDGASNSDTGSRAQGNQNGSNQSNQRDGNDGGQTDNEGIRDENLKDGNLEPLRENASESEQFERLEKLLNENKDNSSSQKSSSNDSDQNTQDEGSASRGDSSASDSTEQPDANAKSMDRESDSSNAANNQHGSDSQTPSSNNSNKTPSNSSESQENSLDGSPEQPAQNGTESQDGSPDPNQPQESGSGSSSEQNSDSSADSGSPESQSQSGSSESNSENSEQQSSESQSQSSETGNQPGSESQSGSDNDSQNGSKSGSPTESSPQDSDGDNQGRSGSEGESGQPTDGPPSQHGSSAESAGGSQGNSSESDSSSGSESASSPSNPSNPSENGGHSGQGGSDQAGTSNDQGPASKDAANLDYTKKLTDLILEKLEDQKYDPDPELLEQMNWTQQDLDNFLNQWKQMKNAAQSGDVRKKRQYEDALRSLGFSPNSKSRKTVVERDKKFRVNEDGAVDQVPSEFQEKLNSFLRRRNRSKRR